MVGLSNESLADVSALLENVPGTLEARRKLVGSILAMLQKQQANAGGNLNLRMVLAKAYLRLSSLQGGPDNVNLGDEEGAAKSLEAGLALIGDSPGKDPETAALWLELRTHLGVARNALGPAAAGLRLLQNTLGTGSTAFPTAS